MSKYLPLDYYDIHLNANASLIINTERDKAVLLFTLSGEVYVGGELIAEKTAVRLTTGVFVELKATEKNSQVLFVSSEQLNEPVAWGGPIVMNTKEELNNAFAELKNGTFLKEGIGY